MTKNAESNNGFTLIELLVSVAIVGLLTSIAIPSLQEYKKRVYDVVSLSDLRNAVTASEAYSANFDAYYAGDAADMPEGYFTPSKGNFVMFGHNPSGSMLSDHCFYSKHDEGTKTFYYFYHGNGGFLVLVLHFSED